MQRRPQRPWPTVHYKAKGQIEVIEVRRFDHTAYKFKCPWCKQPPLFGYKFRRHLVTEHNFRDDAAVQRVSRIAREHKQWKLQALAK